MRFQTPLTLGLLFLAAAVLLELWSFGWDAWYDDMRQGQPVVASEATILLFYPENTQWDPQQLANARFSDGHIAQVVFPSWAWNCRVGDTVKMERQGQLGWVKKPGCTR